MYIYIGSRCVTPHTSGARQLNCGATHSASYPGFSDFLTHHRVFRFSPVIHHPAPCFPPILSGVKKLPTKVISKKITEKRNHYLLYAE